MRYPKLLIRGWKLNAASTHEDFISFGNDETAQTYEVKLINGGSVNRFANNFHANQEIIDFNSNPAGYLAGQFKSARKHKSIFDNG